MRVLIIDSGARGHALAWQFFSSERIESIYVAPGNGGTQTIAENVNISVTDIDGLVKFAQKYAIDFTVVGQEDSLAAGIVDAFQRNGLRIFGPTMAAAELETSKAFAKRVMRKAGVPTADSASFVSPVNAIAYVRDKYSHKSVVIKAVGPALGKGAYVCHTLNEAEDAISKIMIEKVHGSSGNEILVEAFLNGIEVSIQAFCDGEHYVLLPSSQDHKPALDGDLGKNTGGMGAIAPVPWFTESMMRNVGKEIVEPILRQMAKMGRPFVGILYPGLMITKSGPRVLEFNVRPGDPETQPLMRLLKTDLLTILEACVDGTLDKIKVEWKDEFAACVVMASGGYPDCYQKGFPITGIEDADRIPGVKVFHAGTRMDGKVLKTSGGRVLSVTATGETLSEALQTAYQGVDKIRFDGMQYRHDIGVKSLATSKS